MSIFLINYSKNFVQGEGSTYLKINSAECRRPGGGGVDVSEINSKFALKNVVKNHAFFVLFCNFSVLNCD